MADRDGILIPSEGEHCQGAPTTGGTSNHGCSSARRWPACGFCFAGTTSRIGNLYPAKATLPTRSGIYNFRLISQEGHHTLGNLLSSILLQVVSRISHYLKSAVGDHFGDALPFIYFEGEVPSENMTSTGMSHSLRTASISEMYSAFGWAALRDCHKITSSS